VNTSTDSSNCGSCGHSCLGGTCSGGACQPLELGTVPSANLQSTTLILSGGSLYSITNEVVQASIYPQVYQFNPNVGSTASGTLVASITAAHVSNSPPTCILDNKLIWASNSAVYTCTLGSCAQTTTNVFTSTLQLYGNPYCDPSTDEIVYDEYNNPGGGSTTMQVNINRAQTSGANRRMLTFFQAPTGADGVTFFGDLGPARGASDKWFFTKSVYSPGPMTTATTLYYVATNSSGVTPISIGGPGTFTGNAYTQWTNGSLYTWVDGNTLATVYDVPLPNGVTGMPPTFYSAVISDGIMDSQNFYGVFSTLPSDAIGKCSASSCSNPTSIFRGQQGAQTFTQDATAIYWTTSVTNNGYIVWKGAK
jgi:hypothetical protein